MRNTIGVNDFANRQIGGAGEKSRFSYYTGNSEQLSKLVSDNFDNKKEGYREGIYTVPVPSDNFYSGISKINENSIIWSRMEARRRGEEPVLTHSNLNGTKEPAKFTEIVIYSHDVLAENNEFTTDADYEVISINASFDKDQPMTPETIKRNHYGNVGGTNDHKSEAEFEKDLKEAEEYWSKHSTVDDLSNFKRFYDRENSLSNEELKDLIIENCKCYDPNVMSDYIKNNLGIDLSVQDILKIDTTLKIEKEAELDNDPLEL